MFKNQWIGGLKGALRIDYSNQKIFELKIENSGLGVKTPIFGIKYFGISFHKIEPMCEVYRKG